MSPAAAVKVPAANALLMLITSTGSDALAPAVVAFAVPTVDDEAADVAAEEDEVVDGAEPCVSPPPAESLYP
jgi:hypothetical protein